LRGASLEYSKCPASIGNIVEGASMQQRVRSRHETINKRFRQWALLKQIYKGKIENHGSFTRVVCIITQLSIINGESLFSVEYEDPCVNGWYFHEPEDEEEEDYV
jgi:hypothetical protein